MGGQERQRLRPLAAARIAQLSAFADWLAAVHEELGGPAPMRACGPGCGCVSAGAPGPVLVS